MILFVLHLMIFIVYDIYYQFIISRIILTSLTSLLYPQIPQWGIIYENLVHRLPYPTFFFSSFFFTFCNTPMAHCFLLHIFPTHLHCFSNW